jgi:hypothetical protein
MSTRKRNTAIALTGAVALASGAYALGSQAGGGSAVAADPPDRPALEIRGPLRGDPGEIRRHLRGGPFGLDRIADKLGVEESELRDALEDFRADPPDPPDPGDFAEDLARELGIEQNRVEEALERLRDKTEQEMEQRHDELVQRLADRLNVDPDKVEDALGDFPPFGFGWRHP